MAFDIDSGWTIFAPSDRFGDAERIVGRFCRYGIPAALWSNGLPTTTRYLVLVPTACVALPSPHRTVAVIDVASDVEMTAYLRRCRAVVASSLDIVDALAQDGIVYPHVHYVPFDGRFDFFFDRFLLAIGELPETRAMGMDVPLSPAANCVALSLPEASARRRRFAAIQPPECASFAAIRLERPWRGCAMTYHILARRALAAA